MSEDQESEADGEVAEVEATDLPEEGGVSIEMNEDPEAEDDS